MATLKVYDVLGNETGTVDADDQVFGIEPHNQAMFDLVLAERAMLRQGTHSVKNRSAVRGGGRKPWRQKGTGRARQGTIRAPQWRGGGVVFGPQTNRNYELKINRKVANLAMKSGLSQKQEDIIVMNSMEFANPSTKDFKTLLTNVNADGKKTMLILSGEESEINTALSARNLPNMMVVLTNEVLLDDLLNSNKIILTEKTLKDIEGALK